MKKILVTALLLFALLLPFGALADSDAVIMDYTKDMSIQENGDILVDETLTYRFTDDVNGITRVIDQYKSDGIADFSASIIENGVPHTFVYSNNAEKGDKYRLTRSGDTELEYRLYLPMRYGDTAVYHYSYRIIGAGIRYPDIAFLKYALLEGEWELDIDRLTVNLRLPAPVPASECSLEIEERHADSATFVYDESTGVYTITAQGIPDENLIGARLYFPAEYMAAAKLGGSEPYLDTLLAQEAAQAEHARKMNEAAQRSLWFFPLLLALFIVCYFRCDRDSERLVSPGDVRGEIPDDVPPSELSLLLPYHVAVGAREMSAVLMDLCSRGYVSMTAEGDASDKVKDSMITLTRTGKEGALKDYEARTIRHIFDVLAEGEDSITLKQMKKRAETCASQASSYNADMTKMLTEHMKTHGWFEGGYTRSAPLKYITGAVLLLASALYITLTAVSENMIALLPFLPCLFLGIYTFFMRKRTPEGSAELVKWLGLKEWLGRNAAQEDDSAVKPADWERMLVYAGVLLDNQDDVAKRAGNALKTFAASGYYGYNDYALLYLITRPGGTRCYSGINKAVSAAVSSSSGSSVSHSGGYGGGGGGGGTF